MISQHVLEPAKGAAAVEGGLEPIAQPCAIDSPGELGHPAVLDRRGT
jgi:hypothetical protein